jgi:hypothetical protein
MSKKISGAEYSLSKIFSSEFEYVIPSYQRPYAWKTDQVSELFDDLYDFFVSEPEEGYFLGSIVLIKKDENPRAEVIDGQQRLTTLTILLAAITNNLSGEDRDDFVNYLREPGRRSQGLSAKPRLLLRERDCKFFTENVQNLNFEELFKKDTSQLENESQVNIQANAKLLQDRIVSAFNGDQERILDFGSFLILRCYLVVVSTPSQQSAFRVFSVMNSRGLDLQPTDIIKANILGQLQSDEAEDYNDRWEDMEVELGREGFNDLFTYVRMIYAREKAKRSLLEEFKTHVISKVADPDLLISNVLEPHSIALSIIKQSNYEAVSHASAVNHYLRWLNRIDNSDWVPAAICFLVKAKADPEYVAWFFERMERLAAYMHISACNVNERIGRYCKLIEEMDRDHCLNNPISSVELNDEEKQRFVRALDGDVYLLNARRRNYLILRLDSFMSDGAATYDPSILTIEHVLPQTVAEGSEWEQWWSNKELKDQWTHRIANLVPLNQRRNSKARNFDFKTKKEAYFGGKKGVSSYILTTQVLGELEWTPMVLKARQESLLAVFSENWRLGVDA